MTQQDYHQAVLATIRRELDDEDIKVITEQFRDVHDEAYVAIQRLIEAE